LKVLQAESMLWCRERLPKREGKILFRHEL
jgi:hypothetical protein